MDREIVANFHFGIPHKHDAGRDDVQVLYNDIALQSQFYSSLNDIGPNLITQLNQVATGKTVPQFWADFVTWPGGTTFGENPTSCRRFRTSCRVRRLTAARTSRRTDLRGCRRAFPGACPGGT